MESQEKSPMKALVFGATGAVGREVVLELMENKRWNLVAVVTRRLINEWDPFKNNSKFKIIQKDSLEDLENLSKWNLEDQYDVIFSCLGTTRKAAGKKGQKRVDLDYPLLAGRLAIHFKIPHYSLCSSTGAKANSCFFYLDLKGKLEEGLKTQGFKRLSIFRPGLILNRRNDPRTMEKIAACCCCGSRVEARDIARGMIFESELQVDQPLGKPDVTYENKDIRIIASTRAYPKKK